MVIGSLGSCNFAVPISSLIRASIHMRALNRACIDGTVTWCVLRSKPRRSVLAPAVHVESRGVLLQLHATYQLTYYSFVQLTADWVRACSVIQLSTNPKLCSNICLPTSF